MAIEQQPTEQPEAFKYVDPAKSTVAGQLTTLLDTDSPYIQQARRQGLLQAAQRGGTNSTASASAAQREAISAALPIASQDATTFSQAQGREQEGTIASNLSTQQSGQTRALAADQFSYDTRRQAQQISGSLAAIDKQGTVQKSLDLQAQNNAVILKQMGIDADEVRDMTGILGNITVTAMNNISSAINNSNISDKGAVIDIITGFLGDTTLGAGAFNIVV